MRRKNSTAQGNNSPSETHSALDLDPTTNDKLHLDAWKRLANAIQVQISL